MPRIVQCPSCEKKLKVPDERLGTAIKCPGCGKPFKTKKPKPAMPSSDDEFDDLLSDGSGDNALPPRPGTASKGSRKGKARTKTASIQPFVRKWFVGVGIYTAIAAVVTLGGFASEPVAMAATVLWIIGMVGFLVAGWIWTTTDHFQDETWKGLVTIFLAPVGFGLAIRDRGPALRGTIVAFSSLLPALLGLGSAHLFKSKYTGEGRAAARAASVEARLEQLEKKIAPNDPVETVTFKLSGNLAGRPTFASDADSILSEYSMYVPGSAKVDSGKRELTLDCRGGRLVHMGFALLLGNKTGVMIHVPSPSGPTGIAVPQGAGN